MKRTFLLSFFFMLIFCSNMKAQTDTAMYYLLIGSYTEAPRSGKGIYVFEFNAANGNVKPVAVMDEVANPSFLTATADGRHVYAVNELSGDRQGSVSAFSFNPSTGILNLINQQPSKGGNPCYLTLSKEEQQLFVANYTGGSLSVLPIAQDGSLQAVSQHIQHVGQSKNKVRQEAPHVHDVHLNPTGTHIYAVDLGTDRIHAYPLSPNSRQPLLVQEAGIYQVIAGNGPRHLIFNKAGTRAYLMHELSGELSVYSIEKGPLFAPMQTVSLTDAGFEGEVSGAELMLSPDERFLYASNRGDANEISSYAVKEDGTLKLLNRTSSGGKAPRHFTIDPSGRYLLAANQDSDNVTLFSRDIESGRIKPIGRISGLGAPVYLLLIPKQQ